MDLWQGSSFDDDVGDTIFEDERASGRFVETV